MLTHTRNRSFSVGIFLKPISLWLWLYERSMLPANDVLFREFFWRVSISQQTRTNDIEEKEEKSFEESCQALGQCNCSIFFHPRLLWVENASLRLAQTLASSKISVFQLRVIKLSSGVQCESGNDSHASNSELLTIRNRALLLFPTEGKQTYRLTLGPTVLWQISQKWNFKKERKIISSIRSLKPFVE